MYTSMELGPEEVSLLERCPRFIGCYVRWDLKMSLYITEVSTFQRPFTAYTPAPECINCSFAQSNIMLISVSFGIVPRFSSFKILIQLHVLLGHQNEHI